MDNESEHTLRRRKNSRPKVLETVSRG